MASTFENGNDRRCNLATDIEPNGSGLSRRLIYKKLGPTDRGLIEDHLLRLDTTDRQMRFCSRVSDRAIRSYCERIEWSKTTALGCFMDRRLRGMAELVHAPIPISNNAEVALTVEGPMQNQGIGSELLRKTLVLARNRYIPSVYMFCLFENARMWHIARKFEASLLFKEGEVEGRIWPPWPSLLSLTEEATADYHALFCASLETIVLVTTHSVSPSSEKK